MDTHSFLQTLFGEAHGFIELRPTTEPATFLHTRDQKTWATLTHYLRWLDANHKRLPYFGVALRREATNGRYENCAALTCVFADCDFKTFGELEVRAAVRDLPYQPTIVVNTGGGLHLYWLLHTPLTDMTRASRLLDGWVRTVPVADFGVNDAARVLRLPGTDNRKYTPARKCYVESFDLDRRYDIDDLEAHAKQCAAERGESVPEAGVIAPAWQLPDSIGAGERHGQLYKFMRSIQSRYNLTFDEVLPLLKAVNKTRCSPPIGEGELQRYLARGWRSADRAGFERPKRLALQDSGDM